MATDTHNSLLEGGQFSGSGCTGNGLSVNTITFSTSLQKQSSLRRPWNSAFSNIEGSCICVFGMWNSL